MLVETVPERMVAFGAVWEKLSGRWATVFDTYDDDQLALIIDHMRRTVEVGAAQVELLRSGELEAP
ncbi:hypothetical protein [Streptomyces sp. H27-C3]|uniref:hypothetical protein n=1 Tax=Streptomyces sp. H27-C3 TaxID=3046305 RepID=UPI0024BA06FD|nr:hypothetical protein [Streptomyces sp. H27-C3]MDJ0465609.1 hypothetical protein [Streptomyces sp. H27-C3]